MTVNNNLSSAMAIDYASKSKSNYDNVLQQIASGIMIKSTDAATQSIYDSLNSEANSASQGIKNANDGIAFLQIADSAAKSLSQSADTLNELSVAYNNGAMNSSDLENIKQQASSIKKSMSQFVENASFNGKSVFDGESSFYAVGGMHSFSISSPSIDGLDITDQGSIQKFQKDIASMQSTIGSSVNGLTQAIKSGISSMLATTSAASGLGDTDFASAATSLNSEYLRANSALFVAAQSNKISAANVASLLA